MSAPQALPQQQPPNQSEDTFEVHNRDLENRLQKIDFERLCAEEVLTWAARTFPGRAVIETSFQNTGVAIIHMACSLGLDLRVATLDTLRLHPETYSFIETIRTQYGCQIEVLRPDPSAVASMSERFGEFLFFDSKVKQEYCCQIRKGHAHNRLMKTVDCWISGLRRDQSGFRRETTSVASLVSEYGSRRKIVKLNPMATWDHQRLSTFADANDLPQHPLYAKGFSSIGCVICSTPVRDGEDNRAGRWRWFNKSETNDDPKECGLHLPGQHYNI